MLRIYKPITLNAIVDEMIVATKNPRVGVRVSTGAYTAIEKRKSGLFQEIISRRDKQIQDILNSFSPDLAADLFGI